tara:strand:+ start:181 stop:1086 length:906 start_codon:yes stop_codon:yes gene_type:complete
MKKVAFLTLVLLSATLAGCTSGDSGEVQVELTDEQVDDIMDEYFQDFVNNTTVTINDETSNVYYQNGSISTHSNYFIVDYTFTKSSLFTAPEEIDHMNNTFAAIYTEYNISTNQNSNFTYQLDCLGYYLVGIQTTPVPYWENSANYAEAWASTYNDTIADLYQEYASQTTVRWACDENYDPAGAQTGSTEIITILDITIPAGKGLMCENNGIIKMLDSSANEYITATGEPITSSSSSRYGSYLYYQFDSFSDDLHCTTNTLGSGSADTTFTIMTQDRMLDYDEEYRIYLVYTLVDVEDHIV